MIIKTNRALSALSVILLGAVAGLLIGRSHPNPKIIASQVPPSPDTLQATEAVNHSTTQIKSTCRISTTPSRRTREIRQPSAGLVSTNLESPVNSQDLDENRDWARNHPSDALDWLENAANGTQRLAVAEIVCPQLAQTNAEAAVKLAENCLGADTNNAAQYLLGTVAQIWAEQDIKSATAWALTKPAGEERDRLLQHIAFAESKTDPVEAAQLVSQQMSSGSFQSEAAVSVVYQWALQDPKSALAWAESFPAGDLRDRAINEVKNVIATSAGNSTTN